MPEQRRTTRRMRKRASKIVTRRKKAFMYRGKSLEELQKMSLEELLPLFPARVRRKLRRGLTEEEKKLLEKLRKDPGRVVRTHRREMVILPEMVGRKIAVHSGKEFKTVEIQPEMIGHYLGEFAPTRVFIKHAGPGVGATRSSKYIPLK